MTTIDVVPRFAGERAALIELLVSLSPEEWGAPTICAGWSVQNIAAHLLGDDVGFVSSWRDGVRNPTFAEGLDVTRWDDLLTAIDRQNAEWLRATRRISPQLLVELLRVTGGAFRALVETLDPERPAGPVDWAGPEPAPVWLHLAREYSERWVHQQQIRDAVGQPGLTGRRWLGPVLAAFAQAVPRALDRTTAAPGASVRLIVDGEAGGTWLFERGAHRWAPAATGASSDDGSPTDAEVRMDADTAWRLFTKGITPGGAARKATLRGDATLAAAVLESVAVLA